jgi:gliding-associated putative ABC transporter substrate-binding component GldG
MKKKTTFSSNILLIAGIVILVNILAARFFLRLDFTADKRYSLSKATKDILANLPETVTIKAYFTEDLPAQYTVSRRDFKEMLMEYAARSKGNIVYEFIDPNKDQETEQAAMQAGIQPLLINVREKDQVKQQKAFMGAVIQLGDRKDIIPFVRPDGSMEYMLSSSLKKLSVVNKPLIGLIQGHGEPSQASYAQALPQLGVLYTVEAVNLADSALKLTDYVTLALIAPQDSIPADQLAKLDDYLRNGGNIYIAMDRVEGNFQTVSGNSKTTGLETWLEMKGLLVDNNFVVDAQCGPISVVQQQGGYSIQTQVNFPFFPIITTFADNPATKGLEQVMLPFASSITWKGSPSFTFTPLLKSSKQSGALVPPVYFDINKRWTEQDFTQSGLVLGALVEGNFGGSKPGKLLVISNGQFAVNGEGQQPRQVQPDNVSLMVNSIDCLSDATGLIDLRTKGITARPLKQMEDSSKTMVKWLNFLLPIALVIVYGVYRTARRKNQRMRRMEVGYVD